MASRYRYIFGGHAIAAEIHNAAGESEIVGATALPPGGGRGAADPGQRTWVIPGVPGTNSFQSGSASVSGLFTTRDNESYVETITRAELKVIDLFGGRLHIDALSAHLVSEVARDDGPRFKFG